MVAQAHDMTSMTIGEILARHPQAAAILGAHRIDLCRCHHVSLSTAARIAAAHLADVLRDLTVATTTTLVLAQHSGTPGRTSNRTDIFV